MPSATSEAESECATRMAPLAEALLEGLTREQLTAIYVAAMTGDPKVPDLNERLSTLVPRVISGLEGKLAELRALADASREDVVAALGMAANASRPREGMVQ